MAATAKVKSLKAQVRPDYSNPRGIKRSNVWVREGYNPYGNSSKSAQQTGNKFSQGLQNHNKGGNFVKTTQANPHN